MKLFAFLFVLLLATACANTSAPSNSVSSEPIKIGGIYALTSFGASWGTEEQLATQLAINEVNVQGGINGRNLTLLAEDSQTDAKGAITAFTKLVHSDNVNIVIGPTWQASMEAVVPLAAKSPIVLISPSGYSGLQSQHATNLFSTTPPLEYELLGLVPYIKERQFKNFVVVYNDEPYSAAMKDNFAKLATENNWTVILLQQSSGDKDFRTNILKIKNSNVDAIYAPLAVNEDEGVLMKQMQESNLNKVVLSTASTEQAVILQNYGMYLEGIIYPYPKETAGYQEFSRKYLEAYGKEPSSPSAATAYDATNLLIDALKSGAQTPQEIAAYLHNVKDYAGASNTINFNADGTIAQKDYIVKTVKNGAFAKVT